MSQRNEAELTPYEKSARTLLRLAVENKMGDFEPAVTAELQALRRETLVFEGAVNPAPANSPVPIDAGSALQPAEGRASK